MWKKLIYSKTKIVNAGKVIRNRKKYSEAQYKEAIEVVDNWRASHAYPLHIIYKNYRGKVKDNDNIVVAERLKRLTSIVSKLNRIETMNLWEMQDIGGCRVIVPDIKDLYSTIDLYRKSRIKHKFIKPYDYIQKPKKSGYRSYHMVYKYYSDKNEDYNSHFLIEIQVRTALQHLWSTAVETMDVISKQNLKADIGNKKDLRFFLLVSALFAMEEKTPLPPDVPTSKEDIIKELKDLNSEVNVLNRLKGYKTVTYVTQNSVTDFDYFVLSLDSSSSKLNIMSFKYANRDKAMEKYEELEKQGNNALDIVLVSSRSFKELQRAYPNYFVDIGRFVQKVESYLLNV